jgi:Tol biopolymer transport system component
VYDSSGQIFRYDAFNGSNELVSVNAASGEPANGISMRPETRDGLKVAFVSSATDLTATGNSAGTYQVYLRDLSSATTRLVSINTNGQPAARSLIAAEPRLNASGTRVVFDYDGDDLVAGDLNEASDVFVFDVDTAKVMLLSGALPERPALTRPRGVISELNSVSADGSKVTFTAVLTTNREVFVANLTDGRIEQVSSGDSLVRMRACQGMLFGSGEFVLYQRDERVGVPFYAGTLRLFRKNLGTGTSEYVDPNSSFGTDTYTAQTFYPAISRDGQLVVYSISGNLYLKDMIAGTNQVIAQSRLGVLRPPEQMINPMFTPDHRRVLFQHSRPADITTNTWSAQPYQFNLFARDLAEGSTILVSTDSNGVGLGTATAKGLSEPGRYVAFDVWLGNGFPPRTNVYVFDFVTRVNTLICSNCSDPSLSADARLVAYAARRTGSLIDDIYVRDRAAGTVARIGDMVANESSSRPLLSTDGRYVVFTSKVSNYVADDDNGAQDVFLHDRYRGATYRLSAGSAHSARHIISRDGRTVVFQSLAGDLSPGDYNEALDIFYVRLGAGDSDNDGIDDSWEVTYFNDTARDGTGDLDGDWHSDFQEFLAGTDPTNAGSVLEVIAIRSINPSQVRILWSATVGKSYVIQTMPSLDAAVWTNTGDTITANANTMSIDLASASASAFFRAVLVQ